MNSIAPEVVGSAGTIETAGSRIASFLSRIISMASTHRREKRLRLCEMLSLGEKRFVAVVEYGSEKFLLAGTPRNISLLKKFKLKNEFRDGAPHSGSDIE